MSEYSISSSEDAFKFLMTYFSSTKFYWYAYWYVYCVNLFANWPTPQPPPNSDDKKLDSSSASTHLDNTSTVALKDSTQTIALSPAFLSENGAHPDSSTKVPPAFPEKAGGPTRTKRRKTGKDKIEAVIHETYPNVVREVYSGKSLNKAAVRAGISRTSFFKWRYMAEMKIVDAAHYLELQRKFSRSSQKLSEECRRCVAERESPFFELAEQLRTDRKLLPLVYSVFSSRV